jgi:hypothetical protein
MNKLNKLELKSTIIGEVIPMQDKYIIVEWLILIMII